MHVQMEQARGDSVERKPYLSPGSLLYSGPGGVHQLMRRRPPALSALYGGHQHRDKIENTRKGVSKDREQLSSTISSCDDRNHRSIRDPTRSSSTTMAAPQSTENRDRYIHPKLAGRFVPAGEAKKEKLDNVTAQSTPDLSEVYSHFSSGGSTASKLHSSDDLKIVEGVPGSVKNMTTGHGVYQNDLVVKQTTLCDEELCNPERPSRLVENEVSSNIIGQEGVIDLNYDREGTGRSERLSQAGRGSLNLVDVTVSKKVNCEPDVEGRASQATCTIQCSSKKRKIMSFPNECKDLCNIKVGSRVAVYWDGEDAHFAGTVTRERENHKRRFFIEYDDGDREWIDFNKQRFHLLDQQTKRKLDRSVCVQDSGSKSIMLEDSPHPKEHLPGLVEKIRSVTSGGDCEPLRTELKGCGPKPLADTMDCRRPRSEDQKDAHFCDDWVLTYNNPKLYAEPSSSDDSETDEDEIMEWAVKMFGIRPPIASTGKSRNISQSHYSPSIQSERVHGGISEAVKRRRNCVVPTSTVQEVKKTGPQSIRRITSKSTSHAKNTMDSNLGCRVKIRKPPSSAKSANEPEEDKEIEAKRKKELARALTAEEIKSILGEEDCLAPCSTNWVRRSVRQPSKFALNSPKLKDLIEKLKGNDPDMVVLKMKKYVNDPNTPCLVIDAVLAALEENTNCEALYIQNFNEGMRDDQMMSLLQVLQRSSCKIWCLNIGETYKVKQKTWKRFAVGLQKTKITHMYASEHVISTELKDRIRSTIRGNRSKHTMHCDPNNLDTIVKCTHCWWNPVNTKSLRPYLRKRGYDQILGDTEFQGLPGSTSGATLL